MTLHGAKMPSPGWVALPQSPASSWSPSRDFQDGIPEGFCARYHSPSKSMAKKIKIETSDNTVRSGRVVPELPVMMTRSKILDIHEWESLAAMLSPLPNVLPSTRNHNLLPPNPFPHDHFERPKNAFTGCLCISCVGPANAIPQVAACAVCAAQIPYSVCLASDRKPTTPTTVPTMCFSCMRAFV
jgi:hypothetical protein